MLAPAGAAPSAEHRVVGQEGVQPAPDVAAGVERLAQPGAPLLRQPPAHRRDADQDGVGLEGEALAHRRHHRDGAAEAQHVLRRLAGLLAVEHGDGPVGQVADDGVGGLRGQRAEVAVGQDQEAWGGHRNGRSQAG